MVREIGNHCIAIMERNYSPYWDSDRKSSSVNVVQWWWKFLTNVDLVYLHICIFITCKVKKMRRTFYNQYYKLIYLFLFYKKQMTPLYFCKKKDHWEYNDMSRGSMWGKQPRTCKWPHSKVACLELNQQPSSCEVTVLTHCTTKLWPCIQENTSIEDGCACDLLVYKPCKNTFLDLQQLKNDGNKVFMKVEQRPG